VEFWNQSPMDTEGRSVCMCHFIYDGDSRRGWSPNSYTVIYYIINLCHLKRKNNLWQIELRVAHIFFVVQSLQLFLNCEKFCV
jgi:hypothetical protein